MFFAKIFNFYISEMDFKIMTEFTDDETTCVYLVK